MTRMDQFTRQPRAVRWALIALAVIGAYFVLIEPTLNHLNSVRARVSAKEGIIAAAVRDKPKIDAAGATIRLGVGRYGQVGFNFGDEADTRTVTFNQRVAEILRKHGVGQHTSTTRPATLGTGPLLDAVGQGYRVERLINEYQFEAEPEIVTSVLADLERTELVTSVSRVQIRKGDPRDGRKVKATIAAELWSRTPKGRGR